ncbi:MAG: carboxymuconolactone decarboxylase family protein [Pseudomonadota bacterium]
MTTKKTEKRVQKFIEGMRKERGYLPDHYMYLAQRDIDFLEAYDNLYKNALNDGKALPAKVRELVCIGVLAFRRLDDAVVSHIKRALRLGATKQEIMEAIETTIIPGGTPTFGCGLAALMKVEEDEKRGSEERESL